MSHVTLKGLLCEMQDQLDTVGNVFAEDAVLALQSGVTPKQLREQGRASGGLRQFVYCLAAECAEYPASLPAVVIQQDVTPTHTEN